MPEDPLAAFPDVDNGDDETEGEDEDDRALVARHQRAVRDLEGVTVDGLVYEYRTQFHQDPLVTQSETAYYLSVRGHVWDEFGERLDLSDDELARLKEIHAEQFRESVGAESSEAGSGEAEGGEARSGETESGEAESGEARSSDAGSGEALILTKK